MEIQVWQAILIALWSSLLLSGPIFTPLMGILKPMFSGFVIGLILGDMQTGLIAGGLFDLAFLGFGRAGGANPPSNVAPALFGIIWVIASGMDMQVALALSFPIAIFIAFMNTAIMTLTAPLAKLIGPAYKKSPRFLYNFAANGTLIIFLITGFIMGFVAVYTSTSISTGLQQIPEWLMNTFKISGNLLPGVGFAIILSIMLKKVYIPFALMGYLGASYFGLTSIGLLVLSLIVGLIIIITQKSTETLIDKKMQEFITLNKNQLHEVEGGIARGI